MILNLMPCVFPVLAMKILSLERMARGTAGRPWRGGCVCGRGRGVVRGAGGDCGTARGGPAGGLGFQFQSVGFVIVICLLLFAVALNLLGVFAIGLRLMGVGTVLPAHAGIS
ncbi:hypothetical protein RAA17_23055 [Komagataeibacter rhaeticus]|nr:hypothetical protein [Komagataeibacter rhaeticus]